MPLFSSPATPATDLPPTRAGALKQLAAFVPRAGRYRDERNHVRAGHDNVSRLSPAIRHRLLTEEEVAAAPLERHAAASVEKFTQEVYWRRYWKSWLSLRPQVWGEYLAELDRLRRDPAHEASRRRAGECERGAGGLAVMDHFARELVATGYLHNHARMWFAGWWIHVERLPWQLGADFFFRHLLDGDPASNTLSWRWVAGLQTPGKTYLPRRSNIERYLDPGILDAQRHGLERLAQPEAHLPELPPKPEITRRELPAVPPRAEATTGIWIHEEDLSPETSPLAGGAAAAAIVTGHRAGWSRHAFPPRKVAWIENALGDAAARATQHFGLPVPVVTADDLAGRLVAWAREQGLQQLVTLRPEVGPLNDELATIEAALGEAGVRLALVDRQPDLETRALATAGFFNFWKKLQPRLPLA